MSTFDAGNIEATLTLNRDPFQAGLEASKDSGEQFAREEFRAKLGAESSEFDEKTEKAKAEKEELTADPAKVKIDGDDRDFDEKVLAVRAQLEALKTQAATLKINASADSRRRLGDAQGAAGEMENELFSSSLSPERLEEIKAATDDLGKSITKLGSEGNGAAGGLRNAGSAAGSAGGEFQKFKRDTDDASGGLSLFIKAALGVAPAIVPISATLTAGLGGLSSLLASAGAGLGGVALVSKSAFSQIAGAVQAGTTANQALQKAQTGAAVSAANSTTAASAQRAAQNKITSATNSQTSAQQALTRAQMAAQQAAAGVAQAESNLAAVQNTEGVTAAQLRSAQDAVTSAKNRQATANLSLEQAQDRAGSAAGKLTAAQQAAATAGQGQAKQSAAVTEALQQQQQAYAGLTPAARMAAQAFVGFKSNYQSWVTQFQPGVFTMMTSGFKLANQLLGEFTPLIQGSLTSVNQWAGGLGELFSSSGQGGTFVNFLTREGPMAIGDLLNDFTNFGIGAAGVLEAFAPLSNQVAGGLGQMANEFALWGESLADNQGFKSFVAYAQKEAPVVRTLFDNIAHAAEDLVKAAAPVGAALLGAFNALGTGLGQGKAGSNLQHIGTELGTLVTKATPLVQVLGQDLGKALGALGKDLKSVSPSVDALLKALVPLARVAGPNFASGFLSVFKAATPALAATAKDLADILNMSPGLTGFLATFGGGLYGVSKLVKPIGTLPGIFRDVKNAGALFGGSGKAASGLGNLIGNAGKLKTALSTMGSAVGSSRLAVLAGLSFANAASTMGDLASQASVLAGLSFAKIVSGLSGAVGAVRTVGSQGAVLAGLSFARLTTGLGSAAGKARILGTQMQVLAGLSVARITTGIGSLVGSISSGLTAVRGFGAGMKVVAGMQIASLANGFKQLLTILPGVDASMVGFDAAADANPIGAIVLAVAALGAGLYELVTHWKGVTKFLRSDWGTAVSGALAVLMPFVGIPMLIIGHWKGVSGFFTGLWRDISGGAVQGFNDVVGFFESIPGKIKSLFTGAGSWLLGAGRDLLHGLANGLLSYAETTIGHIPVIGGRIVSEMKKALGVHSPSTVFAAIGRDTMAGMALGMSSQHGLLTNTVQGLTRNLLPADLNAQIRQQAATSLGAGVTLRSTSSSAQPIVVNSTSTLNVTPPAGATVAETKAMINQALDKHTRSLVTTIRTQVAGR